MTGYCWTCGSHEPDLDAVKMCGWCRGRWAERRRRAHPPRDLALTPRSVTGRGGSITERVI